MRNSTQTEPAIVRRAAYNARDRFVITRRAAYRACTVLTTPDGDCTFDYRHKSGLILETIVAPANAPVWVYDRQALWCAVDAFAKRKDARLAREWVGPLFRELPFEPQANAVIGWARETMVSTGIVVDICFHGYGEPLDPQRRTQRRRLKQLLDPSWPVYDMPEYGMVPAKIPNHMHVLRYPEGHLRLYQPHFHILTTTRPVGPDTFGPVDTSWNTRARLEGMRKSFYATMNRVLEEHGVDIRFDHRSAARRAVEPPGPELDGAKVVPITPSQAADAGGGYHAAMNDRPPANPSLYQPGGIPMDFTLTMADKNRELQAKEAESADLRHQLMNLAACAGEDLAEAIRRIELREREGATFYDGGGKLCWRDPNRVVTQEDEDAWRGLDTAILEHLRLRDSAAQERAEEAAAGERARAADEAAARQQAEQFLATSESYARELELELTAAQEARDVAKSDGQWAEQQVQETVARAHMAREEARVERERREAEEGRRQGIVAALRAALAGRVPAPTGDPEADPLITEVGQLKSRLQQCVALVRDFAEHLKGRFLGTRLDPLHAAFGSLVSVVAGREKVPAAIGDLFGDRPPAEPAREPAREPDQGSISPGADQGVATGLRPLHAAPSHQYGGPTPVQPSPRRLGKTAAGDEAR